MEGYDRIGKGYSVNRVADPAISAAIEGGLGDSKRVLNIGAGSGSYEPKDREVVALEPSVTMIQQRAENAASVVQGRAESLPFRNDCFDISMGILTLHHWANWKLGLSEALRVSNGSILLLTWFGYRKKFWLTDYFPEITALDDSRFPTLCELERETGTLEVKEVPIPHDCTDGFLCAYWRRPEAYLDAEVRKSISTFSLIDDQRPGLKLLEADLLSGRWHEKYGDLLEWDSFDYGYRLVQKGING